MSQERKNFYNLIIQNDLTDVKLQQFDAPNLQ